jgi:hypothetical protein
MAATEVFPIVETINSVTPTGFLFMVGSITFVLVILALVFGLVLTNSIAKLSDNHSDLTKHTTSVIAENTKALKDLDTTIKDRFLAYLEGEIGKNTQTK